jgi:hypothetical protein
MNTSFLFASLVWGSIGLGYFIYGKRQSSWAPRVGGILMMAISYFAGSILVMSLAGAVLMTAVFLVLKRFG